MNRVRKARAKAKAKVKTKRLTTRRCTAFIKIKNLSEDEVEQVMLQKKVKSPAGAGQNHARRKHQAKDPNRGMERALAKERSRAKRRARPNHNRRRAIAKERARERASRRKVSPPKERGRAKAKTRKVSQVENPTRLEKCTLRQSQSYRRARRCFEHLVAEAGMSCLYSCHQLHGVEEAFYFWASQSRGRFASCIHVKHREDHGPLSGHFFAFATPLREGRCEV